VKPQNHHIWELITRVLSGEANPAERKEFRQWLNEDSANQLFYEELETCWWEEPHEDAVNPAFLYDYERGLGKLRSKLKKERQQKRMQSLQASAKRRRFFGWKVAASIVLLLAVASVLGVMFLWTPPVTSYATSAMEQRIIRLPDGSTVRLNKNSKITFPKQFAGSTRKITLWGEAFFQVNHNEAKPFIIHAGDAVIRDIGTSFNVKEEKDGKVIVAVKEGAASLRNSKTGNVQKTVLRKDQVGILNQGILATIKQVSVQNYMSWISGQIVFKKMPFDEVVRQLDNIYGIHCRVADSSLSTLKLTAYIKDTSLQDVLHMVALSLGIHYREQGDKVVWTSKKHEKRSKQIKKTTK
jgi:ferric-dicitrate binding protein FerR (iron transport regulator)